MTGPLLRSVEWNPIRTPDKSKVEHVAKQVRAARRRGANRRIRCLAANRVAEKDFRAFAYLPARQNSAIDGIEPCACGRDDLGGRHSDKIRVPPVARAKGQGPEAR